MSSSPKSYGGRRAASSGIILCLSQLIKRPHISVQFVRSQADVCFFFEQMKKPVDRAFENKAAFLLFLYYTTSSKLIYKFIN
ncbi:MAG TPA: hypothetical protein DEO65_15660 [Bacillus bacterium]|nr:hypothetical protein [Bacillus sp. (in: firmicutes)]